MSETSKCFGGCERERALRVCAGCVLPVRASLVLWLVGCEAAVTEPAVMPVAEPAVVPVAAAPVERGRNSDGSPQKFPPAPADLPGVAHLYAYEDLGPQALAAGLIGPEWYEFGEHCCFEPGDSFDIRVIIHTPEISRDALRLRYPSGPERGDYRFVGAAEALAFVHSNLAEISAWPAEDRIPALEATLTATRDRLLRQFPAAGRSRPR